MSEGTPTNRQPWMLATARHMARLSVDRFQKLHSDAPRTNLDLGCGVGEFTKMLTAAEFQCVGIDQNEIFVEVARERNPKGNYGVGDFLKADLGGEFGIVSATHEVFNMTENYGTFLSRASRRVAPGGFFVFDIITPRGFQTWQDIQIQERSDFVMIQKCIYDEELRRATIKLTGLVQNGEHYDRFDVVGDVFNHDINMVAETVAELGMKIEFFPEWGNLVDDGFENPDNPTVDKTTSLLAVLTK